MNVIYPDKSASLVKKSAGIPTRSGCLFKRFSLRLCTDRRGKSIYFLPMCIAFVAFLWLGCPARLNASDQLNWLNYETALQESKDVQRPLLLFFTSPWCYQCTEMKRKVFKDKDIISLLNERFLLVEVDISEEKQLKEDFLINYTPTSLLLDISGKPIIDVKGYIPTNRFRKLLWYVSQGHYKTTAFSDFEKKELSESADSPFTRNTQNFGKVAPAREGRPGKKGVPSIKGKTPLVIQ
ncbi:MAG: thioredoxin family protein [Desulfuromonadaceae bacterium]|nr:thioredoxin family protein [Desulfuromonadaceae bacterium]